MPTKNAAVQEDSVDLITDALLTASRLLVAISARSIAQVDETITTAQFRTLVILSDKGPMTSPRSRAGCGYNHRRPAAWSTGSSVLD